MNVCGCITPKPDCSCGYTGKEFQMPNRHADTTTVDHLISLTKLANRYSSALMSISLIDGSDAQTDINLARRLAREALFPEKDILRDQDH